MPNHHRRVRQRRARQSRPCRAVPGRPAGESRPRTDRERARVPERDSPRAFEIAFSAVTTPDDETLQDEEPIPLCRRCRAMIGIFPDHGLDRRDFRGDGTTSGAQEIYDSGHAAQVTWILADEGPEEL